MKNNIPQLGSSQPGSLSAGVCAWVGCNGLFLGAPALDPRLKSVDPWVGVLDPVWGRFTSLLHTSAGHLSGPSLPAVKPNCVPSKRHNVFAYECWKQHALTIMHRKTLQTELDLANASIFYQTDFVVKTFLTSSRRRLHI